jgi:predicted HicB family RNase H-like nuclease
MSSTIHYKGYTASMEFDSEDKIIVGRVLGIDDIIAFHAKTEAEFQSNFHEAVDAYLTASAALGSHAEKPATTANLPMKTSAKSTT